MSACGSPRRNLKIAEEKKSVFNSICAFSSQPPGPEDGVHMVCLRLAVTGGKSACNSVDGRCAYTDHAHGSDSGTHHYSVREGMLYHWTAKYLCTSVLYFTNSNEVWDIIIRCSLSGFRQQHGTLQSQECNCMSRVLLVYRHQSAAHVWGYDWLVLTLYLLQFLHVLHALLLWFSFNTHPFSLLFSAESPVHSEPEWAIQAVWNARVESSEGKWSDILETQHLPVLQVPVYGH